MHRSTAAALLLVGVIGLSGCAARSRPVASGLRDAAAPAAAPEGSLGDYIEKIRHVSAAVRPVSVANGVATLESRDPGLAAALERLRNDPGVAAHIALAEDYRVRGVLDAAHKHFTAAVKLDAANAAAYEGLARTWRDWGVAGVALGDAARARFYAPQSAAVHNTLGTILQALGRAGDARVAYERAVALDPRATYALNNLCYLSFLEGRMDLAVAQCQRAVEIDPALKAARYNLALAHAGGGRMDLAAASLAAGGDAAEASFNLGILHLARRDYRRAASAFDAASRARPTFNLARERALEARVRLHASAAPGAVANDGGER